jgi:hypothetical protein
MAAMPVAIAVLVTWALAGCGGASGSGVSAGSVVTVKAAHGQAQRRDREKVIDPREVRSALRRTHYRLSFTPGQRPARFRDAIYGSASNSHGVSIHFGFFIAPGPNAAELAPRTLRKLVPEGTAEGTQVGASYVLVTSAKGGAGDRASKEQFEIMYELEEAVAKLAPAAYREEGP